MPLTIAIASETDLATPAAAPDRLHRSSMTSWIGVGASPVLLTSIAIARPRQHPITSGWPATEYADPCALNA